MAVRRKEYGQHSADMLHKLENELACSGCTLGDVDRRGGIHRGRRGVEAERVRRAEAAYTALPGLPPEIWLTVFAYATYIPGALTHDDGQALVAFSRDKYGISAHRRHREATDLMRAVSRVCKAWTPLATEFLFKYVLIKGGDHAVKIAAALGEYGKYASSCHPAGRWTVRLELALEGVHRWDEEHTVALARIFAHCPNITVFSTAFSTADASLFQSRSFLRAVCEAGVRSNLKRLELRGDIALLGMILPPLAPSLEALWILPSRRIIPGQVLETVHLPLVHTFILYEGFGWGGPPPTWTMPALRTLHIEDDHFTDFSQRRLQAFFEAHGPQLQHLVACQSAVRCLGHCSNLTEWTVSCSIILNAARLGPVAELLPPTVRYLTLVDDMSTTYMLGVDHVSLLAEWLRAGLLPALEKIRFLLPLGRHIRRQRSRGEWEQIIEVLLEASKRRGLLLEASVGGDEHTAGIWRAFSVDHLLDPHPFSAH
ncbi:hypothetical protein BV20DRAFT_1042260 [Pilatotrama ljubarskyi]|nr:hypothetical protein BV20DRAFT_1042260 [Pilatotrama ljubarskyi]